MPISGRAPRPQQRISSCARPRKGSEINGHTSQSFYRAGLKTLLKINGLISKLYYLYSSNRDSAWVWRISGLARDRTAESVSGDHVLMRAHGHGKTTLRVLLIKSRSACRKPLEHNLLKLTSPKHAHAIRVSGKDNLLTVKATGMLLRSYTETRCLLCSVRLSTFGSKIFARAQGHQNFKL